MLAAWALALGAFGVSMPAPAEIKWQLSTGNTIGTTIDTTGTDCGSSTCLSLVGNTRTFAGNGTGNPAVTAQAWSNTGGVNGSSTTTTPSQGTLQTAYLGIYGGGLGAKNRDGGSANGNTGDLDEWSSPQHGVDNRNRFDTVLFSYQGGTAVDLNQVAIGYKDTDSDITILAYTGAGTPTLFPTAATYTDTANVTGLTDQGWQFIGHYTNLPDDTPVPVNPTNVTSAYWLIGSYIPGWGDKTISTGNDHVKILALYGDKRTPPPGIPEPNVLLLLGIAAAGIWATRRRRTA